jgi:hypothetical protein
MANDYNPEHGAWNSADTGLSTAAPLAAPVDLRAQVGYPTYCPQRIVVVVGTTGTLVFKDRSGKSVSMTLPVGVFQFDVGVASLEVSTMTGTIHSFWWLDSTTRFN